MGNLEELRDSEVLKNNEQRVNGVRMCPGRTTSNNAEGELNRFVAVAKVISGRRLNVTTGFFSLPVTEKQDNLEEKEREEYVCSIFRRNLKEA